MHVHPASLIVMGVIKLSLRKRLFDSVIRAGLKALKQLHIYYIFRFGYFIRTSLEEYFFSAACKRVKFK